MVLIAVGFVGTSIFLLSETAVRAVLAVPKIGAQFGKQAALFQAAIKLGVRTQKTASLVILYSFLFHLIAYSPFCHISTQQGNFCPLSFISWYVIKVPHYSQLRSVFIYPFTGVVMFLHL